MPRNREDPRDNVLTPEEAREGREQRRRRRGWTNLGLKWFGYFLILLSLVSSSVIAPSITDLRTVATSDLTWYVLLEAASWVALPVFAWLLVDGFNHTSSRRNYFIRLCVLALVSQVPYSLANSGRPFDFSTLNPVFGLVVCFAVVFFLNSVRDRRDGQAWFLRLIVGLAALLYMLLLRIDLRMGYMWGGVLLLGFSLIFFFLQERENTMIFAGAIFGIIGFGPPIVGLLALHIRNGRLGYFQRWTKWVFYALYPLLLLVFGLYRTVFI